PVAVNPQLVAFDHDSPHLPRIESEGGHRSLRTIPGDRDRRFGPAGRVLLDDLQEPEPRRRVRALPAVHDVPTRRFRLIIVAGEETEPLEVLSNLPSHHPGRLPALISEETHQRHRSLIDGARAVMSIIKPHRVGHDPVPSVAPFPSITAKRGGCEKRAPS